MTTMIDPEIMETDAVPETAVTLQRPVARNVDANALAEWTPRMVISIDDAVAQVHMRDEFMSKVMRKDFDYGVIPGTQKPTLLKPGAERLLTSYGLHPELSDEAPPVLDLAGERFGEPFLQYRRVCRVWRQTGLGEKDRMLVAQASGECNSWETKYRYRNAQRVCPLCKVPAIIKGKAEYGGGWVCFKRKDGCGEKFGDTDKRITDQEVGKIANPDPAEQINTLLKMADKRALVAATIIATGWSDLVTQDIEDNADSESHAQPSPAARVIDTTSRPVPPVDENVSAPSVGADGLESGQRAFREGDMCPVCQDLTDNTALDVRPGKLRIAKGGPSRGQLQCGGKVGGQWANHPAPISAADEERVRQMEADGDIDPDDVPF